MSRVCYFLGKKTTSGNKIAHRGKAKYLGGVGVKTTGITRRKFKPNIQKVRAVIDGKGLQDKSFSKGNQNGAGAKTIEKRLQTAGIIRKENRKLKGGIF